MYLTKPNKESKVKTILKALLILSLTFLSYSSFADPIQDNVFQVKRSGWFPSSATPCPIICKKLKGSAAESESFFAPQLKNKYTAVCKAPATMGQPTGKGWLYGNNFSAPGRNRLCMVSTPQGKVQRKQKFYCLCVFK
tara:strand:- start:567 stop:980 length:414 start_codon:yes stop_codon:yes gene_type:complete